MAFSFCAPKSPISLINTFDKVANELMIKKCTISIICFCVFPFYFQNTAWGFDGVVVSNVSISENSIKESDIRDIFTWEKRKWSDGTPVTFALLVNKSTYKAFIHKYFGMSVKRYEQIIRNEIYINNYRPPKCFKTDEKLIQYVSETPGAIGFVSREHDTFLVKPIVTVK